MKVSGLSVSKLLAIASLVIAPLCAGCWGPPDSDEPDSDEPDEPASE